MGPVGTKPNHQPGQHPPNGVATNSALQLRSRARTEIPRLFWQRRRFLFNCALAGLVLGVLVALLIPARYESAVQLMPPDSAANTGLGLVAALSAKTGGALGSSMGDVLGIKGSGALFVGILRSQTIEDRLVQRFELQKIYSLRLPEDARHKLSENSSVSEDRKSGIITITVADHDRQRAAALAQAYAEELDRVVSDLSTSSARRERIFLEERLRAVKLDLDLASREFGQFASKNVALDLQEQGRAMFEGAALLQGQLIAAEAEQKGLEEIFTPNNVRVRSVQARIAELRRQLGKIGGVAGPADSVTNASVTAPGDSQIPTLRKLPLLGVAYADLYRRRKIQEVVYETLTQQYELAKVQEAKEIPSVKVLDRAQVPGRKSFPPRTLIVLTCALLALLAAMAQQILHQRWLAVPENDSSKLLAEEILQSLRATMPWAAPNGSRLQAASHRVWTAFAGARSNASPRP